MCVCVEANALAERQAHTARYRIDSPFGWMIIGLLNGICYYKHYLTFSPSPLRLLSLVDAELAYYLGHFRSLTRLLSTFTDDFHDVWPIAGQSGD